MIDIQELLTQNQFLTGGFVLGAIGCVIAALRKWPGEAWGRLKSWFVIEVDVPGHDEAFLWINYWLSQQSYSRKKARFLTVVTRPPKNDDDDDDGLPKADKRRPEIIFSPAPGNHVLRYRGCWVLLRRDRKDGVGKDMKLPTESFNIKFFSRDRGLAESLLGEARELIYPAEDNRIKILHARWDDWNTTARRRPRPEGSVILKSGIMEGLVKAVDDFKISESWYVDRGIPWRLGILLYGPPGSGKSSTVAAIASHFEMDIAILNLNMKELDDNRLGSYLADVPNNAIVLLEDIDCVFQQREGSGDKVTFSGLLNAVDGVAASEGRILFMTTNYMEKLDPALIRPGRVDVRFEIGAPDRDQCRRLFQRFYPDCDLLVGWPEGTSMAALQGHFLKHKDSAHEAITNPID